LYIIISFLYIGLIQVHSAYFSFKVLPDLKDAGYYSDKAVLSRTFVHENSFFQLMACFGSIYYGPFVSTFTSTSSSLSSSLSSSVSSSSTTTTTTTTTIVVSAVSSTLQKVIEYTFVFYPYIFLRPWFPRTKFQSSSRTNDYNERFYRYGAMAIKIFYLWSKYFLGFYINFLIFLMNHKQNDHGTTNSSSTTTSTTANEILSKDDLKFIRGLFLLNVGTVSIAVFLHTLRFKKVLPPRLTFSIYLVQIYLTFSAIPYLGHLFKVHCGLVGLVLLGMVLNMTRSNLVHGLWCVLCHYLLVYTDIQW
jgi:hypothetical protein